MTREEREKKTRIANMLIGTINNLQTPMLMYQVEKDVAKEALENYIKALEQQPCEDCISRQAVDDYITNLLSGYLYDEERTRLEKLTAFVWELPSVTPKAVSEDEYKKGYSDGFRDCLNKNVFCVE